MNESTTMQVEQPTPSEKSANKGPSVEFFAIGMAVNLVLIVAFLVWAFRQGKKK